MTSVAVYLPLRLPASTSTVGWAFRLRYHAGCPVLPKLEAIRNRASPSVMYTSGDERCSPDFTPVVVSSITGSGYPKLNRPPVNRSSAGSSLGGTLETNL